MSSSHRGYSMKNSHVYELLLTSALHHNARSGSHAHLMLRGGQLKAEDLGVMV